MESWKYEGALDLCSPHSGVQANPRPTLCYKPKYTENNKRATALQVCNSLNHKAQTPPSSVSRKINVVEPLKQKLLESIC